MNHFKDHILKLISLYSFTFWMDTGHLCWCESNYYYISPPRSA